MEILNRYEAFTRAVAAFGPWNTWGRAQHLAYGFIRGVPHLKMEKCSNDNPESWLSATVNALYALGAWPEMLKASPKLGYGAERNLITLEVKALFTWVRKPVRVKAPHLPGTRVPSIAEAGE